MDLMSAQGCPPHSHLSSYKGKRKKKVPLPQDETYKAQVMTSPHSLEDGLGNQNKMTILVLLRGEVLLI